MAPEKPEPKGLIRDACEMYGIPSEYVVAAKLVGDEAVIVTAGGAKVRYRKDQKIQPLPRYRVTGIGAPSTAGKK